jgi:hypothetical protein
MLTKNPKKKKLTGLFDNPPHWNWSSEIARFGQTTREEKRTDYPPASSLQSPLRIKPASENESQLHYLPQEMHLIES